MSSLYRATRLQIEIAVLARLTSDGGAEHAQTQHPERLKFHAVAFEFGVDGFGAFQHGFIVAAFGGVLIVVLNACRDALESGALVVIEEPDHCVRLLPIRGS